MLRVTPIDIALLVLQGAIWGSAFQAAKIAVDTIAPMSVAASRLALGAAVLMIFAVLRGRRVPRDGRTLKLLALTGLFNCALPFFLISWGVVHIDSTLAVIFMAAGPLLVLLLAHFTSDDERLTPFRVLGFIMGFVGVLVVFGLGALSAVGDQLWAQLAVLAAAMSYAVSGAIARRIKDVPGDMTTAMVLLFGAAITIPLSLIFDRPWNITASTPSLLAILYLGLMPTALAFLIRFILIPRTGYTFASMVSYLVPVFGVIWGALLLGEAITNEMFVALGLILGGIIVSRIDKQHLAWARKRLGGQSPEP